MINLPPSSRIALGTANINGQQVEVFMSAEWARYFESLNTQSNSVTAAVGRQGAAGAAGAALGLGSDDGNSMEFIPGPPGLQGPAGQPGPAIFLLQEPESNDVFWPVKNT